MSLRVRTGYSVRQVYRRPTSSRGRTSGRGRTSPLAHTPMSHQWVQFPPERTLISIRNQVPEGVRAFHEGMKVSLWAERYILEVSVPCDLPRASLTDPLSSRPSRCLPREPSENRKHRNLCTTLSQLPLTGGIQQHARKHEVRSD